MSRSRLLKTSYQHLMRLPLRTSILKCWPLFWRLWQIQNVLCLIWVCLSKWLISCYSKQKRSSFSNRSALLNNYFRKEIPILNIFEYFQKLWQHILLETNFSTKSQSSQMSIFNGWEGCLMYSKARTLKLYQQQEKYWSELWGSTEIFRRWCSNSRTFIGKSYND